MDAPAPALAAAVVQQIAAARMVNRGFFLSQGRTPYCSLEEMVQAVELDNLHIGVLSVSQRPF